MYQPQTLPQTVYSFGGSLNSQPLYSHPAYPPQQYNPIANSQVYPQPLPSNTRISASQLQPQNSLQYSQLQPSYSIQQQPSFLPPNYLVQPMSVMRRHPQTDISLNFDYESAHFLVESKITQPTIYCVLCQAEYQANERQQHIKKHVRTVPNRPPLRDVATKLPEKARTIISKPIVQPEEVNIQYQPTVYRLNKQILFEDDKPAEKKDISLGFDGVYDAIGAVEKGFGNAMNVPASVLKEQQAEVVMNEPKISFPASNLNESQAVVQPVPRQQPTIVVQPQNLASLVTVTPSGNVQLNHPPEQQHQFSFKQSSAPTVVNSHEQPSSFALQPARETFQKDSSSIHPQDPNLKRGETKQKEEFIGQPVEIRPSVPRQLRTSEDSFLQIMKGVTGDVQIEGEERKRMPSRVEW